MVAQGGGYAIQAAPQYAPQPTHQGYAPQQTPQAYAQQGAAAPAAPQYAPQPPVSYANPQPQPQPRSLRVGPDLAIRPASRVVQQDAPIAPARTFEPTQTEDAFIDEHGFAPPVSERPVRPVRMPDVSDFPPIMQRSIEPTAVREPAAPTEKKRQSLIERLTHAGFGKKGEAEPAQRSAGVTDQAAGVDQRRAPALGRGLEDDQLEIPAFLRRQSN
jgi:cell division protein FtsZ